MTVDLLEDLIVIVFVFGLIIGAATTIARTLDLHNRRVALPILLVRDVIVIPGLAWPFALILLVRAADAGSLVRDQLWWTLVTTIPPLLSVATYVYFELAVIGRRQP